MNTTHRPDPEFLGSLERELRSTIRRQGRFDNGPSPRVRVILKLRWATAVVALIAMCIGSAGTFAVTHRLRAQTADLIIARSEAHLEFANARLELFLEEFQETESRVDAGLLSRQAFDATRLELTQIEADAAARAHDVEEARITGHDPDNSLSAPMVQGRDFVTERLVLQQALLLERVSTIDEQVSTRELDLNERSTMVRAIVRRQEAARAALSIVEQRLALRRDYLSGVRTARQVELADMQSSVEPQRALATRRVEKLLQQLDRAHVLFEDGYVTRSHVRAAEMEFRAAVLQLDLVELEMQILESKLADSSDQ